MQQESYFRSGVFDQLSHKVATLLKESFETYKGELKYLGRSISETTQLMSLVHVLLPLCLASLTLALILFANNYMGVSVQNAAFMAALTYAIILLVSVVLLRKKSIAKLNSLTNEMKREKAELSEAFSKVKDELHESYEETKDRALESISPVRFVKKHPESFVIGTFTAGLFLAALSSTTKGKK